MSRFFAANALLCLTLPAIGPAEADELRLSPDRLLEISASDNVVTSDGKAIELARGVLVEDDGPAAGYSYRPNEERLSGDERIKKELVIPDPRAEAAWLLLAPGGELTASINGKDEPLTDPAKMGGYWQQYKVPVAALAKGHNDIVLRGSGRLWIARDDEFAAGSRERSHHANRSAKSTDGGQIWNGDRLGTNNDIDGEYCVRLWLDQYRPAGSLTLPVLDSGNLSGERVGPPLARTRPVLILAKGEPGPAGRIAVHVRSGPVFAAETKGWTKWQPLGDSGEFIPAGRYVQIRLELTAGDPRHSPALREVVISSQPQIAGDWRRGVRVTGSENPPVVRSSIPFEYEPLDHPRLKTLREKYRLDDVVAGAKTELELISKLAVWSAARWDKGHLQEAYPAWDCLDILADHKDGTPVGGFCQQYNVVFLQACESFGLCGRAVSLGPGDRLKIRGGHEVVEIWSNEYRKWIYVDGNAAWFFVDNYSGVPLSLRELRLRQLETIGLDKTRSFTIVKLAESRYEWKGLKEWPPFAELRLIPRSNFLEQKSPLPLNQGMRGWFWTGHYVWTDDGYGASPPLYSRRVTAAANWDWTLNEAHIILEATATPGELRVMLDTVTPSFESFEVNLDGAGWNRSPAEFAWKLKSGDNRLEARATNIAGRPGSTSLIQPRFELES